MFLKIQKSENGLNVCLNCFQAFSKNEMFDYTQNHSTLSNHCVFVNIKEVKIESDEDINSKDKVVITKLAIGKEGGIDFDKEKWEIKTEILCLKCNKNYPSNVNQEIENNVKTILNSASSNQKESIKAWENEIFPCEHTLTLVQESNVKILSKQDATCNNCSLNSNLWLCLVCGNLGCGRKQYDGTGGNSHGLEHFQNTKHCLSVKTGTITPDGNACKFILYSNLLLFM